MMHRKPDPAVKSSLHRPRSPEVFEENDEGARRFVRSDNGASHPADRSDSAAGLVLLIHAVLVVLFTVTLAGLPEISRVFESSSLKGAVLGALLMHGGFILLPTLLTMTVVGMPPGYLTGSRAHPGSFILSILIGIPAAVVFSGLNNLLLFFLSGTGFKPSVDALAAFDIRPFGASVQELVLIIIVSILLPAISEELMFRGLVQGSLMLRTGEGTAIFLQAFAFMLFHNNPAFLLPPLLAGLLLGLIRSRSGSILTAIAAHISLNSSLALISTFLPRFSMRFLNNAPQSGRSLLYASLIASCLAAVALIPLVVLIANAPPQHTGAASGKRLIVDMKFILAIMLMLATIGFVYFNN